MSEGRQLIYDEYGQKQEGGSRKKKIIIGVVIVVILAIVIPISVTFGIRRHRNNVIPPPSPVDIAGSLKVQNIMGHLNELYNISTNAPLKSRSVVDGYNASASYVIRQLQANGVDCDIEQQYFDVPLYVENTPPTLSQITPENISFVLKFDFAGVRYGGNGTYDINNIVTLVDNFGCNSTDFVNFPKNGIALILPGICTPYAKSLNAEAAGAAAILLANGAGSSLANWRVRSLGWTYQDPLIQIPILGVSSTLAQTFSSTNTTIRLTTNTTVTIETTYNILCLSRQGQQDKVMIVGAHLDGVPEGPGINDNGSGSSSILEIALEIKRTNMAITNKILFAWWGAEEIGLLGSRYFVSQLQNSTTNNNSSKIMQAVNMNNTLLNLNFDMLGSPNFVRVVYDGTTVAKYGQPQAVNGSIQIQQIFQNYFQSQNLTFELNPMSGGSDYLPFIEAGIPAGALATGAGGIKTTSQRTLFGGLANAPHDPCYHLYCDTVENINQVALEQMAKSAAMTIQSLSQQSDLRTFLQFA